MSYFLYFSIEKVLYTKKSPFKNGGVSIIVYDIKNTYFNPEKLKR